MATIHEFILSQLIQRTFSGVERDELLAALAQAEKEIQQQEQQQQQKQPSLKGVRINDGPSKQ